MNYTVPNSIRFEPILGGDLVQAGESFFLGRFVK